MGWQEKNISNIIARDYLEAIIFTARKDGFRSWGILETEDKVGWVDGEGAVGESLVQQC